AYASPTCGPTPGRHGAGNTPETTSIPTTPATRTGARRLQTRSASTARRLDLMDSAEYESRGLYDPNAPNAADRLALLNWLSDQGITIDQMVDAHERHHLTGLAGDLALRPGRRFTLTEVAEESGLTADQVRQLRLTIGRPDERAFSTADLET